VSIIVFLFSNAKLTHGSLESAGGSKTGRGEGTEAAQAASVTEPVKLWPHFLNDPRGEPLGAAYGWACFSYVCIQYKIHDFSK